MSDCISPLYQVITSTLLTRIYIKMGSGEQVPRLFYFYHAIQSVIVEFSPFEKPFKVIFTPPLVIMVCQQGVAIGGV